MLTKTNGANLHPGRLPPIPGGPNAKLEQKRRAQALMDYFKVPNNGISVEESARILTAKIIQECDLEGSSILLPLIPHLDREGLDVLLKSLVAQYFPNLLRIEANTKKSRGRPRDPQSVNKKAARLVLNELAESSDDHKNLLKLFPSLAPSPQLTNQSPDPVKSSKSMARSFKVEVSKRQSDFDEQLLNGTINSRLNEFVSRCSPETADLVNQYIELSKQLDSAELEEAITELKEKRTAVFYRIVLGPGKLRDYKAAIAGNNSAKLKELESSPGDSEGQEFLRIVMPPNDAYSILGVFHLRELFSQENLID